MKALQNVCFGRIYAKDVIDVFAQLQIQPEIRIEFNKLEYTTILEGIPVSGEDISKVKYCLAAGMKYLTSCEQAQSFIDLDKYYILRITYRLDKQSTWVFQKIEKINLETLLKEKEK